MNRLTIKSNPQITCTFNRDDWQLVDKEGVESVVLDLNFQLETFVNAGYSKNDVRKLMHEDMVTYTGITNIDYGTCDSEPRAFLEVVLDEIFGAMDQPRLTIDEMFNGL